MDTSKKFKNKPDLKKKSKLNFIINLIKSSLLIRFIIYIEF